MERTVDESGKSLEDVKFENDENRSKANNRVEYIINQGSPEDLIVADNSYNSLLNLNSNRTELTNNGQGVVANGITQIVNVVGTNRVAIVGHDFTWNGVQVATLNDVDQNSNNYIINGTNSTSVSIYSPSSITLRTFYGTALLTSASGVSLGDNSSETRIHGVSGNINFENSLLSIESQNIISLKSNEICLHTFPTGTAFYEKEGERSEIATKKNIKDALQVVGDFLETLTNKLGIHLDIDCSSEIEKLKKLAESFEENIDLDKISE